MDEALYNAQICMKGPNACANFICGCVVSAIIGDCYEKMIVV